MSREIRYNSHLPVLIKALSITSGDVLEFGTGFFSTPVIHWMCLKRNILSYESNEFFWKQNRQYHTDNHSILWVKDWSQVTYNTADVALVDLAPAKERIRIITELPNKVKLVIIHDTENEKEYNYNKIYPLFKYRFDFNIVIPHTTVLSDFVKLHDFMNIKEL